MWVQLVAKKKSRTSVVYQDTNGNSLEYKVEPYCLEYSKFLQHIPPSVFLSIRGKLLPPNRITEAEFFIIDIDAISQTVSACDRVIIEKRDVEEILQCSCDEDMRARLVGQAIMRFLSSRRKGKVCQELFAVSPQGRAPSVFHIYDEHRNLFRDGPFYRLERLLLALDSSYRDHIFHIYTVYSMGALILSRLSQRYKGFLFNKIVRIAPENKDTLKLYANEFPKPISGLKRVAALWGYTAFFHDIGYLIEKAEVDKLDWLKPLFDGVINFKKLKNKCIPLEDNAMCLSLPNIGRFDLADSMARMHAVLKRDFRSIWMPSSPGDYCWEQVVATRGLPKLFKNLLYRSPRTKLKSDHGVVAATMMFRIIFKTVRDWCNSAHEKKASFTKNISAGKLWQIYNKHVLMQDVIRAGLAIALHNLKPRYENEYGPVARRIFPIRFCEHPIAFILVLCDELFDWWRPRDISRAFAGAGVSWYIHWENHNTLLVTLNLKYIDIVLLADILRTIAKSKHLSDKSLVGKIDCELVELLTGKDLKGRKGKHPPKIIMGNVGFNIKIEIIMPTINNAKIAIESAYKELTGLNRIATVLSPPDDESLERLCAKWIHPSIKRSNKDLKITFEIQ